MIQKHKLDEFDFTKFGLPAQTLESLKALDMESKLPFGIPFKTTSQLSGFTGGDSIKTQNQIPDKYTNKLVVEEVVIKAVKVGISQSKLYGVIICATWEQLIAVVISGGYKLGVIVPVLNAENLQPTEIHSLPSLSGKTGKTTKLLMYATIPDYDKIEMVSSAGIKNIWDAVMKAVDSIVNTEGQQATDVSLLNTDNPLLYRNAIIKELKVLQVEYAKNASTNVLESLLRAKDPNNKVLAKQTTANATAPPPDDTYAGKLKAELKKLNVEFSPMAQVNTLEGLLRTEDPTNKVLMDKQVAKVDIPAARKELEDGGVNIPAEATDADIVEMLRASREGKQTITGS